MKNDGTRYLIVIGGATATGKTALAIRLAQHFDTDILSADSRQFYREMSIGTAKPTPAELAQAPHHFIDSLSVQDDFSVGDFERAALALLEDIFKRKNVAILVGGSGLFLQAVCEGLDHFPEVSAEIKQKVSAEFEKLGLPWLQEEIRRIDPAYFATVDQQNPARLRRALEVFYAAGLPYSSYLGKNKAVRAFTPVYLLLDVPRPELYQRIEARVDDMLVAGLEKEARNLLPFRHLSALRTVGYDEFFEYFDGDITYAEAVDKIKQHSRNYAKRQATWFRKHGNWMALRPGDWEGILNYVTDLTR
ncbi:MAG TPA: tRNA (adenosine(37)-N6)-dimethylallyltransferase MiaA [Saprospiraceae bacterium]|nr:tRNA (adenosine(37)-N6)-dimethylallyltransferase MiaA [Saprospiraceae bacterium]HPI06849.1 tRNA (adenosine(37)-N6)-dimethylallyltransferase MiaA [Saprospiraceae bacterium]